MPTFASRAGVKLDHAITAFSMDVTDLVCADLGCNVGGFVDCLLQRGAQKVYAVDTGYGVLDWKLRKDPRVVVMERTNAMHLQLPEPVDLVTIDVAWTRQRHILPAARRIVSPQGWVISLIKPHYEAEPAQLSRGVLAPELISGVIEKVKLTAQQSDFQWIAEAQSPITGTGGNIEFLAKLKPGR